MLVPKPPMPARDASQPTVTNTAHINVVNASPCFAQRSSKDGAVVCDENRVLTAVVMCRALFQKRTNDVDQLFGGANALRVRLRLGIHDVKTNMIFEDFRR